MFILEGHKPYISQFPLQLGVAMWLAYGQWHVSRSHVSSSLGIDVKEKVCAPCLLFLTSWRLSDQALMRAAAVFWDRGMTPCVENGRVTAHWEPGCAIPRCQCTACIVTQAENISIAIVYRHLCYSSLICIFNTPRMTSINRYINHNSHHLLYISHMPCRCTQYIWSQLIFHNNSIR